MTVAIGLMVGGLAIKSGLFPFHFWMPDTYGRATPASAGILSGVVSKGYIFLLIKIIYQVIGIEVFAASGIQDLLLVLGIGGSALGPAMVQQAMGDLRHNEPPAGRRNGPRIYIEDNVLERASFPYLFKKAPDEEEELEEFRTFLEELAPEDFQE